MTATPGIGPDPSAGHASALAASALAASALNDSALNDSTLNDSTLNDNALNARAVDDGPHDLLSGEAARLPVPVGLAGAFPPKADHRRTTGLALPWYYAAHQRRPATCPAGEMRAFLLAEGAARGYQGDALRLWAAAWVADGVWHVPRTTADWRHAGAWRDRPDCRRGVLRLALSLDARVAATLLEALAETLRASGAPSPLTQDDLAAFLLAGTPRSRTTALLLLGACPASVTAPGRAPDVAPETTADQGGGG